MIAVIGSTGKVGGKVAAMLLEMGIPVRALARSPEKAAPLTTEGAEVVQGDISSVEDIRRAFDRCESAFLITPQNLKSEHMAEEEIQVGRNYAEALNDSAVRHVVYVSVIGAREHTGIPHFESKSDTEDALSASGVDCTFLRPAYIMENFYSQWPMIQQMGIISLPFPRDLPRPMVAAEDVAYAAAQSLRRGAKGQESYDMLGPGDYTMAEVAQIIGDIAGTPIRYVEASEEEAVQSMIQTGMSRQAAQDTVTMYQKFRTMQFNQDRQRVYDEFNFEPTTMETLFSAAAGALKVEAR